MTGTDKQLRNYVKNIFNDKDYKIVEMVHSRLNDAVQVTFKYISNIPMDIPDEKVEYQEIKG